MEAVVVSAIVFVALAIKLAVLCGVVYVVVKIANRHWRPSN